MSLLWHRRAIARAVAGDLAPAADARLRAHLRGCASCRAFYDQLSGAAEAMAQPAAASRAAARERARLERALAGPPTVAQPGKVPARFRARRNWLVAGAVLAPAAALIVWLGRTPRPLPAETAPTPAGDIGWRGAPSEEPAARPALVVYASRRDAAGGRAPLRLVGELPGSGTLRVARADFLQFGVRGLSGAATVTISARGEDGAVHNFLPRAGSAPPTTRAGTSAAVIGPSFDLTREPSPGRYGVTARFARQVPGDGGRLDDAPLEVSGFLIIEP